VHQKRNALPGGVRRLSVRAVKAAGCAFTGAKRTALTEEADGAGARSCREGPKESFLEDGTVDISRETGFDGDAPPLRELNGCASSCSTIEEGHGDELGNRSEVPGIPD